MRATTEALEGNKVKLSVEIDESEFDLAMEAAYRKMASQVRMPGFRPGKVPRRVLEARLGRTALRLEAIQDALPGYYEDAVKQTAIDAIDAPHIDITSGQESGAVAFDAIVEVRPSVAIAGYEGIQVTLDAPVVTDDEVEAQIDRMRGQQATMKAVERAAATGDHVKIDLTGSRDGKVMAALSASDLVYEVGSGDLVDGLDAAIDGMEPGATATFEAAAPDGEDASFEVVVKEVNEKVLPDLTDDWASEVSEFSTVVELTNAIRESLEATKKERVKAQLYEAALDALVGLVEEEPPQAMVESEARSRVADLEHRLSHQGISLRDYLQATGTTEDDLLEQAREGAPAAAKADLALRALADAESMVVSEEDFAAEVARMAEGLGQPPEAVKAGLERSNRVAAVLSELRKSKAMEWLVSKVSIVDAQGNAVGRESLGLQVGEGNDEASDHGEDAG